MKKVLFVLFLSALFLFSGCDKNKELSKVNVDNLVYDGTYISWQKVDNAIAYKISIESGDYIDVKGLVYQYNARGEAFTVKIVAVGEEDKVSEEVSKQFKPLGKISNLTYADGELKWDAVQNATGYKIVVGGTELPDIFSHPSYTELKAGRHAIKVRAIVRNDNSYFSEWSDTLNIQILQTPSNVRYNGERISWNAVTGSIGYNVKINGTDHYVTDTSFIYDSKNNDFTVEVQAVGNTSANIFSSDFSEEKEYIFLDAPSQFRVVDGTLTWDPVEKASEYQIKIGGVLQSETLKSPSYSKFISGISYQIQIKPIITGVDGFFSDWSNIQNVLLLEAPKIKYKDGQVIWDSIKSATGYDIIVTRDGNTLDSKTLGELTTNYSNEYQLPGTYKIKVKANADESKGNYSSAYSNELTIVRLDRPQTPSINDVSESFDQTEILFSNVLYATAYSVKINGAESLNTKTNRFVLPTTGQYTGLDTETKLNLSIYSLGDVNTETTDRIVLDSLTGLDIVITKLAVPQNVKITGNIISWDTVNEATQYIVTVDGKKIFVRANQVELSSLSPGNHSIKIRSCGNGKDFISSNYSTEMIINQLDVPKNIKVANNILTWDPVSSAKSYVVKIGEEIYTVNENKYSINDDQIKTTGTVINVYAKGDGQLIVDSTSSSTDVLSRLSAPSSVSIDNDKVWWDSVTSASHYNVYVNGNLINKTFTGTSFSTNELAAGTNSIEVVAVGDGVKYFTSTKSAIKSVTKLSTPDVELNAELTKYVWNNIPGTINYLVKVDGEQKQLSLDREYAPALDYNIGKEYVVEVIAVGDGGVNSISSTPKEIKMKVLAPVTPKIIVDINPENNVATITVEGGSENYKYNYNINGIDHIEKSPTYEYTLTTGDNIIKVQNMGDYFGENEVFYCKSEFSTSFKTTVLSNPDTIDFVKSESQLKWNAISGASYDVKVIFKDAAGNQIGEELYLKNYTKNTYVFDSLDPNTRYLTVTIRSIGFGSSLISALTGNEKVITIN